MYHRILVPLDGSHLAEQILPHVELLARYTKAESVFIRVPVYAYDHTPSGLGPYRRTLWPPTVEHNDAIQEIAEYLRRVKCDFEARGLKADCAVVEGTLPAEAIVNYARQHEVDLIAMSTHGYTGFAHAIFGSVAEQVLKNAGKPVLLFRPKTL